MKIIVLDFTSGKVFVESVPVELQGKDGSEILTALDYDESNCQYMITSEENFIEYVN